MNARVRFIALAVAFAVPLYAVPWWLMNYTTDTWRLGYAPAVIAVMLAAQGVAWRRRLVFAGVTAAVLMCLFAFTSISGMGAAADALARTGADTNGQGAAFAAIEVFFLGVPLAALALFVGRRPSVLWTASEARPAPVAGPGKPGGEGGGAEDDS